VDVPFCPCRMLPYCAIENGEMMMMDVWTSDFSPENALFRGRKSDLPAIISSRDSGLDIDIDNDSDDEGDSESEIQSLNQISTQPPSRIANFSLINL